MQATNSNKHIFFTIQIKKKRQKVWRKNKKSIPLHSQFGNDAPIATKKECACSSVGSASDS